MSRRLQVIANPAAGQGNFDVRALNAQCLRAGLEWDVRFTKQHGDARRFAREAVAEDVDLVAVFGGDGSVAEVAGGMIGSKIPMGILPGGTANVMAMELGIPSDFNGALDLITSDRGPATRSIDVGKVGDDIFVLRLSMGLEAKMVAGADRELKDRLGTLAYALSALRAIAAPEVITYRFTLDGARVEIDGVACVIANSANLGAIGLSLARDVSVSDGLLDVFVVKDTGLSTWLSLLSSALPAFPDDLVAEPPSAATLATQDELEKGVLHWQARHIRVETAHACAIQCDGEMIDVTPVDVHVIPGAVKIIVPKDSV